MSNPISAIIDAFKGGGNKTQTEITTPTDFGAIAAAAGMHRDAYDYASTVLADAFTANNDTLSRALDSVNGSQVYAQAATSHVLDITSQVNDTLSKNADNVLNYSKYALNANTAATKTAIDSAAGASRDAFNFASSAQKNANSSNANALDFASSSQKNAENLISGNIRDVLDFAGSAQSGAQSTVKDSVAALSNGVTNAINKVSEVVKGANTSDSVATIKYIVFAVVGVATIIYVAPKLFNK